MMFNMFTTLDDLVQHVWYSRCCHTHVPGLERKWWPSVRIHLVRYLYRKRPSGYLHTYVVHCSLTQSLASNFTRWMLLVTASLIRTFLLRLSTPWYSAFATVVWIRHYINVAKSRTNMQLYRFIWPSIWNKLLTCTADNTSYWRVALSNFGYSHS
jgi:hypothetical protein